MTTSILLLIILFFMLRKYLTLKAMVNKYNVLYPITEFRRKLMALTYEDMVSVHSNRFNFLYGVLSKLIREMYFNEFKIKFTCIDFVRILTAINFNEELANSIEARRNEPASKALLELEREFAKYTFKTMDKSNWLFKFYFLFIALFSCLKLLKEDANKEEKEMKITIGSINEFDKITREMLPA